MTPIDPQTALQRLFAAHPALFGAALPPLPETGCCGVCGAPGLDPQTAARGTHTVLPPDVIIPILLCPDHAGGT